MITERPMGVALKDMLLSNEPFQYAHLIKFERPSRVDANGIASTSKERYAYLTDASRDVNFDDGSTTLQGIPNGTQVYLANKVLKITGVSEQTEAKANTFNLTLDGNGIGAYVSSGGVTIASVNSTTWDITWPSTVDLIGAGFREGDKITTTYNGSTIGDYNIQGFRSGNVLRVTKIDSTPTLGTGTVTISLSSEEIKSILLNKNLPSYASFVNREVFIYRAYFQDGGLVSQPILLFRGIISNVAFDDSDDSIQVTWGMTSHWGDFAQVRGRITSDDFHRALDQNGIPQASSALKPTYAYDKGFSHAETSINLLSTYKVQVEKQDVKAKKGFFGIGAKVKVKKYFVTEDRNTDLDFQLQAKSIPVIYGVRNTSGIAVFADTKNDDSSSVYVCHALSEGEIGGIYDVYIDGNSLICNDKADFDARSQQTSDNTVELICRGRADRGDVLGGTVSTDSETPVDFYDGQDYLVTDFGYNFILPHNYLPYVPPVVTVTESTGKGVVHGESIKLTSPQEITLDVFSGKGYQEASSALVEIAQAGNFKIQNDYWTGTDTAEYWGPNHRLLDTAYVVANYKIAEGETTVPGLEFIVRGKTLNCYNYDYSYSHYTKASGENADNFNLGDMVNLYNMSNALIIAGTVQIIDKWTFTNSDGTSNTRFRFSTVPNLGYNASGVPSVTKFYMKNGSNQTWTMVTWNYEEFNGTVSTTGATALSSISNNGGKVRFTYASKPMFDSAYVKHPTEITPYVSVVNSDLTPYVDNPYFSSDRVFTGTASTSTTFDAKVNYSEVAGAAAMVSGKLLAVRNAVHLSSGASGTDGYYTGQIITISRYDPLTDKQISQEAEIVGYNGPQKTVYTDTIWSTGFLPKVGDTVVIRPKYADNRVSINPAIQTMDYITSKTYGKGLDPMRDLDLPSWMESARACDTQSNVTVFVTSATMPSTNHRYRYPSSGTILWQGDVVGNANNYVEFTNCLGKLTNKWNDWKSYRVNELVYADDRMYQVTSAGLKTTKPTHTGGTTDGLLYIGPGSLTITSSNGGPVLTLYGNGNPIRAELNGQVIPGYSLYDSDGVDYWRLAGWDEHSQRYVTRHQTNLIIDTSLPLFDNLNSLLEHFGGILRYSGGKYYLEVEDYELAIASDDTEVRNITADHIIGKIRLSDEGLKSAFNSLTAAYADPSNKFEARNISFFNSTYLNIDRNVPKKGNVSVPGITNYYNTRILADKFLNKSRFGLTISFTMAPRGLLLLSGKVIQLQYPRYGWVDKKFRISNLTNQSDGTVDIVAEEYDDSFYVLSNISKQAGSGLGGTSNITAIASPTDLRATSIDSGDEAYSGVELTWTNNPKLNNSKNAWTELYSSFSQQLYITVNTISGNVLTSSVAHGLKEGELITSQSTINGLSAGKSYFIKTVPSTTTFTVSETKDGATLGLIDGTSVGAVMLTANLIATVPTPTNYFVDVFGGIDGRIVKYYWVRHKVVQA